MSKTVELFAVRFPAAQPSQLKEHVKTLVPSVKAAATRPPETKAVTRWIHRDLNRRIEYARDYMLEHLEEPMQVSDLGELAGVSASHFYPLFKNATGYTPNNFFIRARMHRACELLQETKLSVKEIAAVLGYDDQFYFSRVFKSVSTVPPVHFRNLNHPLQRQLKELLAPRSKPSLVRTGEPGRLPVENAHT